MTLTTPEPPTRLHFAAVAMTTRLDKPADARPDGTPRTVADAICDHLASGMLLDQAAALVGVARPTVYAWLRDGAKLRQQGIRRRDMTKVQRLSAEFHEAAELALAECERRDIANLNVLAAGGLKVTTTVVKAVRYTDADGNDHDDALEVTTTTRTLPPDLKAITWRLERRWPGRWHQPDVIVDLPVAADGRRDPVQGVIDEARRMVERQREVKAALPPGVIDAQVVDEKPLRLDDDDA